jgi:excisionase family DNA binding protein
MEVITKEQFEKLEQRVQNLEARGENRELLDVKAMAAYLQITKHGIYGMIKNNTIPYYKNGKKAYFKRSEIDRMLNNERIKREINKQL